MASASYGAPDQAFVVIPHPMGGIKLEDIQAKTVAVFPAIPKAATEWKPKVTEAPPPKPPYPAEVFKFKGSVESVSELYYKAGWTDGLPIIPPTKERVKKMLKGTTRAPDEVIGLVPPRNGILTVELVAINAVMAGCEPRYMPVIITAMEALLAKEHNWSGLTTTTNPTAPLIIVNGPIVKELGIGYAEGALGGGVGLKPNVTIGRAINLIGDVVGGSKPPSPDKSALGQVANIIAMVLGENEDANPWEPLHVELGFSRDASVVTVLGAEIPININDHDSTTAEGLLTTTAYTINSAGNNNAYFWGNEGEGTEVLLILSPEHAATIAGDGWKKDDIRQFLYEKARIPAKSNFPRYQKYIKTRLKKWTGPLTPETMMPIIDEPAHIKIIVAGGSGKHSQYVSSFGGTHMVTKVIKR